MPHETHFCPTGSEGHGARISCPCRGHWVVLIPSTSLGTTPGCQNLHPWDILVVCILILGLICTFCSHFYDLRGSQDLGTGEPISSGQWANRERNLYPWPTPSWKLFPSLYRPKVKFPLGAVKELEVTKSWRFIVPWRGSQKAEWKWDCFYIRPRDLEDRVQTIWICSFTVHLGNPAKLSNLFFFCKIKTISKILPTEDSRQVFFCFFFVIAGLMFQSSFLYDKPWAVHSAGAGLCFCVMVAFIHGACFVVISSEFTRQEAKHCS